MAIKGFAEHYDVIVKLTFDLLNMKCRFITVAISHDAMPGNYIRGDYGLTQLMPKLIK